MEKLTKCDCCNNPVCRVNTISNQNLCQQCTDNETYICDLCGRYTLLGCICDCDDATDFERGIDHDYCPNCMDSMHGWIEDGSCNACGWIEPS